MKRVLLFFTIVTLFASCSSVDGGQLTGVQNRPAWFDIDPYGMAYVPMGSFVMGENDQDVPYANVALSRTVSLAAFYVDDSEITNNEYRQFVYWVKDSIARTYLLEVDEQEFGITVDAYGNDLDEPRIRWDYEIPWDGGRDGNEDILDALDPMFYSESDRYYGKKHIDITKLRFQYSWIDYKEAARKGRQRHYSQDDYQYSRADFIKDDEVDVYPDTLAWIADFSYSYNEPMAQMYFWHPAYDYYPVVGVTWKQAKAFSHWRTRYFNDALDMAGLPLVQDFRLPTESEWEYAARGGLAVSQYPWGGPYIRNDAGCFLANFKPLRGNYVDDGGFQTVNVYSYSPNDYGIYCMSGNVAEWTNNAYSESAYEFGHDMNADYQYDAEDDEQPVYKRKVIRGGSWKDVGYYLGVGVRSYEYQDTAKCYIGFRNVMSYLGRAKGDEI
ncbi:MAG: SUMF1/EgtB/PvdO family nonheme iron enzyme [Salibacteraceae bacterium]